MGAISCTTVCGQQPSVHCSRWTVHTPPNRAVVVGKSVKLPRAFAPLRRYRQADLFLVFGTSLKVQPVSRILQFIPAHVPQVNKAEISSGTLFPSVEFDS